MKSIFEKNYCGNICYSCSVENRISDVKSCNDIGALKAELKNPDLQKTVVTAINRRIRKLEKTSAT